MRNFAAYAAALAGYTAAIIAIDVLGPVGSTNGIVFIFAIDRALEICIGIVSAGVVLALTDLGHARRKLATECAALSGEILDGFGRALAGASVDLDQFRSLRRGLLRRVIALDPMIDAAIGEASDLRYRSAALQRAVAGLMETLSAWRKITFAIALKGDFDDPPRGRGRLRPPPEDAAFSGRHAFDRGAGGLARRVLLGGKAADAPRGRNTDAEAARG